MKVKDLKHIIDSFVGRRPELLENEVVIKIARPSMGSTAACQIVSAHFGSDFNRNNMLLYAKEPLVEKPESMEMFDAAFELMFHILKGSVKKKRLQWYDKEVQRIYDMKRPNWREEFKIFFK